MNDLLLIRTLFPVLAFVLSVPLASAESVGSPAPGTDGVFDAALSDDMLADQRGKAQVNNTNNLDAALYENSATDVVTGSNTVSDGSLTNNAGLATVIQNSGNNVLIQNAVILNLQLR